MCVEKGYNEYGAGNRCTSSLLGFNSEGSSHGSLMNRQLNWVIHVAAITQISHDTPGRVCYDRKVAEGKTSKEAIRALKRQVSDVVYRHLVADARQQH